MFRKRKSKQNQHTHASTIRDDLRATRRAGIRTAILVTALVSGVVPAFFMMFSSHDNAIPFSQHLWQMWSIALLTYPLTIVVAALTILRKRGLLGFGNLLLTISIVIFCGSVGNALGVLGSHETAQTSRGQTPTAQPPTARTRQGNAPQLASFHNAQPVAYANDAYGTHGSAWQNQQYDQQTPARFGSPTQLQYQNAQYQNAQYQTPFASIAPPTTEPKTNERRLLLGLPKACLAFFSSYYQTYGFRTFLASVLVGMFAGTTANRFLDHVPQNRRTAAGLAKSILQSSERPS